MIVLNQYIIHGSCPFLEVCTKWIMVPSEAEKYFLCWKVNMAGVVAAKLKLKKQQQEEEAAQVSKDKNFYVISKKLIKNKTHPIEFFLSLDISEQVWSELVCWGEGGLLQTETENNFQGWTQAINLLSFWDIFQSEIVLQQLALLRKGPTEEKADVNIPFFISVFVLLLGLLVILANLSENKVMFFYGHLW